MDAKQEDDLYYNFIITKIELTPTKKMIFYNKGEEIFFHNFSIGENEDVKIGDKIVKEKDSKVLRIFRKNKDGGYKIYLVIYSNNII
jgi:hypothetical protein